MYRLAKQTMSLSPSKQVTLFDQLPAFFCCLLEADILITNSTTYILVLPKIIYVVLPPFEIFTV